MNHYRIKDAGHQSKLCRECAPSHIATRVEHQSPSGTAANNEEKWTDALRGSLSYIISTAWLDPQYELLEHWTIDWPFEGLDHHESSYARSPMVTRGQERSVRT